MCKRITVVMFLAAMLLGMLAGPASAHNAGHVILPSGVCVNVGSFESVVLPDGAQAPSIVEGGETHLDLKPGPGDQYGARWAADQSLAVLPGGCP